MPYDDLLEQEKIRPSRLAPSEIRSLLAGAEASIRTACLQGTPAEIRHNLAYDAARMAAQAVMACEGFRTAGQAGHHQTLFQFLRDAAEGKWATEAAQFETSRVKRNRSQYHQFGLIAQTEADQLVELAMRFLAEVRDWLQTRDMLPKE